MPTQLIHSCSAPRSALLKCFPGVRYRTNPHSDLECQPRVNNPCLHIQFWGASLRTSLPPDTAFGKMNPGTLSSEISRVLGHELGGAKACSTLAPMPVSVRPDQNARDVPTPRGVLVCLALDCTSEGFLGLCTAIKPGTSHPAETSSGPTTLAEATNGPEVVEILLTRSGGH